MKFGIVKSLNGKAEAKSNGNAKQLFVGDFVGFGDSVATFDDSCLQVEFNDKCVKIDENLCVKLDESVVYDEGFECGISSNSLQEALKMIENFRSLEELIFIEEVKSFDYYDIDFSGLGLDE